MRGRGGGIGIGACGGAGGAAPGRAWPAHAPLAGIAMELVSRSLFLNPSGFPLPLPLPPFPASSIGGEAARSCVHMDDAQPPTNCSRIYLQGKVLSGQRFQELLLNSTCRANLAIDLHRQPIFTAVPANNLLIHIFKYFKF